MGTISSDFHVDAPQERVFGLVSDIAGSADTISSITRIEMLTEGPVGVGTRWRETRLVMKKQATEEMEITGFDAPNSYSVGCDSCGARYDTYVRCMPDDGGTRLAMEIQWKPVTFGAKLMAPIGFLMQGMLRKCIEKDLGEIKAAAEAPAGAPAPA